MSVSKKIEEFANNILAYCVWSAETASHVFLLVDSLGCLLPIALTYAASFNIQSYIWYYWMHLSNKLVGKDENLNFCNNAMMLMQFVIFKPLKYRFEETIGFDIKTSFASLAVLHFIRQYNKIIFILGYSVLQNFSWI